MSTTTTDSKTTTATPPPSTTSKPEGWRLAPPGSGAGPYASIVEQCRLVDQLTALDVQLPEELVRLPATWAAVQALIEPRPLPSVGLRADAERITALVAAAARQRAEQNEVAVVIQQTERELLNDSACWFQSAADSILDRLRPQWDAAATAVTTAVAAGVRSGSVLRDASDGDVGLWRAAYGRGGGTDVLSAIASARVAMSQACAVVPAESAPFGADFSICFNAPKGWWSRTGRSWEQVPDPQLLSIADSAALRWQRRPSVYADANAEAHHRRQHDHDIDLDVARRASPADLNLDAVAGRFKG